MLGSEVPDARILTPENHRRHVAIVGRNVKGKRLVLV